MSNSFSNSFSASKTAGSPYRSYDEYQTTRRNRVEQLSSDIQAKKEKDVEDLQDKLRDLMFQLSAAHEKLILDEREFLQKKDLLSTELKQIKINADVKFSNARIEYIESVDQFTEAFNLSIQEYIRSLPNLMEPSKSVELLAKSTVSPRNSQIEETATYYTEEYEDEETDNQLYKDRIQVLEEQKKELLRAIKEEERNNQIKLEEISLMIDNQESTYEQEITKLQNAIKAKEEQYEQQILKLYADLQKAIDKRMANAEKRQQKVGALQAQVDKIENDTREKLKLANQKAEKLKASLRNINLRKSQQLEFDRKISAQTRELNEESLQLQQQMFTMQRELQKAKAESQIRRRELTQQVGPRRVQSLFS